MPDGFTANFGFQKSGLSNVQRAWLDDDAVIIGSFAVKTELVAGSGVYWTFETPPPTAWWLAWKTGEALNEKFLVLPINVDALVFNYGEHNAGKSIGYQFIDDTGTLIGAPIVADIVEYAPGIFLPTNVVIPSNAEFVGASTIEASPFLLAGTLNIKPSLFHVAPIDGPWAEEVEI